MPFVWHEFNGGNSKTQEKNHVVSWFFLQAHWAMRRAFGSCACKHFCFSFWLQLDNCSTKSLEMSLWMWGAK